jgi:2-phosphoglycerate kinase
MRSVLLIGGPSGAGKSIVAAEIGRRLAIPWLMVDDLRLAFQRSRATLPVGNDALHFFADIAEKSHIWRESPERLRDTLIAVGEAMSPAIEAVILNHIDQRLPIVIEGDGVLPSLLTRSALQLAVAEGMLRAVFIVEPGEAALLDAIRVQARGDGWMTDADVRVEARAKWLFGTWLAAEARRLGCRSSIAAHGTR